MNHDIIFEAGYRWEKQFFGKSSKNSIKKPHKDFDDSMFEVLNEETQIKLGWDPQKPSTPLSKEVFECIKSYLPENKFDKLRLFNALGTSLDFHHGVDAVFILDEGEQFYVTVDLTTKYVKSKNVQKADIILSQKAHAGEKIWRFCKEVSDRLQK